MENPAILERELTSLRPVGGKVERVKIVQHENESWFINIVVSWRGDQEFNVCLYDTMKLKTYARLSNAVRHVVMGYDYDDNIVVKPKKGVRNKLSF